MFEEPEASAIILVRSIGFNRHKAYLVVITVLTNVLLSRLINNLCSRWHHQMLRLLHVFFRPEISRRGVCSARLGFVFWLILCHISRGLVCSVKKNLLWFESYCHPFRIYLKNPERLRQRVVSDITTSIQDVGPYKQTHYLQRKQEIQRITKTDKTTLQICL